MAKRDIIVIGGSAGAVEALTELMSALPADLDAAIFVTVHFPRTSRSALPRILERAGPLPAAHPRQGEHIRPGHIYVAPPDHHLLLSGAGVVQLVRGPTENGNRPAIDPMFRSAAIAFGARVIGVVLSGALDDGTAGLFAVRRRGGIGVAQAPEDAMFRSMPTSAIQHGVVQHVSRLSELGALLRRLTAEDARPDPAVTVRDDAADENAYAQFDLSMIEHPERHLGHPSPYSCPDCGGVLWEVPDGDMYRFRCRVGHGWTSDALLMQQAETLDAALWTALRAMEESANLHRTMATRARERSNEAMSQRFAASAQLAERRAQQIRDVLARGHGEDKPDAHERRPDVG